MSTSSLNTYTITVLFESSPKAARQVLKALDEVLGLADGSIIHNAGFATDIPNKRTAERKPLHVGRPPYRKAPAA